METKLVPYELQYAAEASATGKPPAKCAMDMTAEELTALQRELRLAAARIELLGASSGEGATQ